ncbi:Histidine kinase [Reichenbachiella faecimaris]|uniref:Histidine kinase n=1 Tax=Reichenbachiella faecimaris TaxID=692418 RepID=A0A1W2GL60_REIFA|nr:histidine kinase [Reichenbachiella faecimaris]SMD37294.1 Histidine kinase [Reichenbachiella faecimaris]
MNWSSLYLNFMQELKKEWFWHVLFWVGYLLVKIFIVEYFREDFGVVLLVELISLPLKMLLVYLLIFYLIPKFLLNKQYLKFCIWLLALIVFAALARRLTDIYVAYPISMLYFDRALLWDFGTAFRNLVFVYPVVGLATAIYLMSHWVKDYQMRTQLQREKLEAELKYLKAQVHPHFLFNTINNIYSLSLDQSPKTAQALLELSDLLSYMLYECNVDRISLKKEIELIENYINLERLRYSERLELQFHTDGEIEDASIAPLILLPFVDNCFKHGAGDSMAECFVHFTLTVKDGVLFLNLKNSVDNSGHRPQEHSGIGLPNTRKRLEGEYPDRYELEIKDAPDLYEVKLTIGLDEKS